MSLQNYHPDPPYSYVFGVYPVLELIKYRPDQIIQIFYDPKGESNQGLFQIKQFCLTHKITLTSDARLVQKISESDNAYCLAQFSKYSPYLNFSANHLVLAGPRDMGNLGTIVRTMVGFDFTDLVIIKPAVDIFNPKTLRASMGELFQINFQYFNSFSEYQQLFPRNYYPLMTSATNSLETTALQAPLSFIFGNESTGLDDSFNHLGTPLKIYQSPQIDSLNLAISVGITLHYFNSATVGSFSHKK